MSIYQYIDEAGKQDLLDMRDAINAALRKKFPGKNERKKQVNPEDQFRIECHRHAKEWLSKNGYDEYQWSAAQNKGLNGLLENIRCSLCKNPQKYPVVTPETVLYSFAAFMCSLPPFYANKVDFLTFHHKFNAIVQEIRSIKNGQQQATTSIANGQFSERFQSVAERIAARHAGK